MKNERGFALIEAVLLATILLLPMIWLLALLAEVHRGALAATSAAREAGIDAARSADRSSAAMAVDAAVARAFVDHGLDPRSADVRISTDHGFRRGGVVEVVVSHPVEVIAVPLLGNIPGPAIRIDARNVTRIEPFASRR